MLIIVSKDVHELQNIHKFKILYMNLENVHELNKKGNGKGKGKWKWKKKVKSEVWKEKKIEN